MARRSLASAVNPLAASGISNSNGIVIVAINPSAGSGG